MAGINIKPYVVRMAASSLRKYAGELYDSRIDFNSIKNEVESAWISQYTGGYLECIDNTANDVKKVAENLEKIADKLDSIAAAAEKLEKELQQAIMNGSSYGGNGRGGGGGGGRSW